MQTLSGAVIRVGDGRGFVVQGHESRLVITAAHCLPERPTGFSIRHNSESVYRRLIGPLEEAPTITGDCYFVDPVSDLAVLGAPDSQAFWKECDAFEAFLEARPALPVAVVDDGLKYQGTGWMLWLSGEWSRCQITHRGGPLWTKSERSIDGGMSGSPILNGVGVYAGDDEGEGGGPHPRLFHHLPVWLARELTGRAPSFQDYEGRAA
jgi:hypothetical protein